MISNKGFTQLILTPTRSWNQQRDSCLDQIWLNCKDRLINFQNLVRGASDHNAIICKISQSDIRDNTHNVLKRRWKNFKLDQYRQYLLDCDWSPLYQMQDPELANSFVTDKITLALDSTAPLKVTQHRRNYRGWLTDYTKLIMSERDCQGGAQKDKD